MKHDDSADEHLDSLLRTIMDHEKKTQKAIDAEIVTWRGMMTKVGYLLPSPETYSENIGARPLTRVHGYHR